MKLKILGMALLALAATSAFAVTNASGTVAGHFTHEGPTNNARIVAHEAATTPHQLTFFHLKPGTHETDGNPIHCEKSTYEGTVTTKTVTTITMTPTYTNCTTNDEDGTKVTVDVNGCSYTFSSHGPNTHGTVTIDCPVGKQIEITHPLCTITIPAQTHATTLTGGITYDTVVENNKHALTATVTVNTITGHYHAGLCVFLGTAQKFQMVGSVTVTGEDHAGNRIPITHT